MNKPEHRQCSWQIPSHKFFGRSAVRGNKIKQINSKLHTTVPHYLEFLIQRSGLQDWVHQSLILSAIIDELYIY